MRSPENFIVKPVGGRRYDNIKDIGGASVITSVSEEDHEASNRFSEVVELPIGYTGPIQKGHVLLTHHNVFKFYNTIKGDRKSGKSFLYDDLFHIDNEQFYMFHDGEKWNSHDRYVFVEPVPVIDNLSIKKLVTHEPLVGKMKYTNPFLQSKGVENGDLVCFQPDSEYKFIVDNETLYRLYEHQIVAKLN